MPLNLFAILFALLNYQQIMQKIRAYQEEIRTGWLHNKCKQRAKKREKREFQYLHKKNLYFFILLLDSMEIRRLARLSD